MQVSELILVAFLVWQISSMPLPVWIASAFFGVDSDDYNQQPGWAENKFSFENNKWGLIVFGGEFLKGLAAISILKLVASQEVLILGVIPFQYVLAVLVVLGHTFPVYNEFKRTPSMGAYFGMFAGLWLIPGMLALAVFVASWVWKKKVSITSFVVAMGSLVIVTFIFIGIKALVIAIALSSLLIGTNFKQRLEVVRA